MLTINPISSINYNKSKYMTFGANNNSSARVGVMSLDRNSNNRINFEKDLKDTKNADMVKSNPIKAIGYNFIKAYNILCTPRQERQAKSRYVHVPYYMA